VGQTHGVPRPAEFHTLLSHDECAVTLALSSDGILASPASGPGPVAVLIFSPSEIKRRCFGEKHTEVWDKVSDATFTDYISNYYGSHVLSIVLDAFRDREYRLAAFPPKVSLRYWDDAPLVWLATAKELERLLSPPWSDRPDRHREDLIATATLSLDLRKSTYCMEFASSEKKFGQWVEHLVEKMRSVAHLHGGVFDKFTGDGALIHFLGRECHLLFEERSAVDSAIHCAVDLQRAVEIHMKALRQILHHDSPVFGAGIAIDVGDAFWSFDHRDNPVVVGRGVVGACRLADKAPRLSVRLTNWAFWSASADLRDRLKQINEVSLRTKESSDDVPLLCWEFTVDHDLNVGRGLPVIEDLCKKTRERFEAGRGTLSQRLPDNEAS
jgi:class 3 adenylate cyclase